MTGAAAPPKDKPSGRSGGEAPLAVAVVTYNSAALLPGLLDSLARGLAEIEGARLIIVDNDSADGSAELALLHPIRPEIVRMGRNAGYAAGINAAAAMVGPAADLLVLNPDIRLFPSAVRAMRARLADAGVGVVAPRIVGEDGELALSLRREPSLLTCWAEAVLGGRLAGRLGIGEVIREPRLYDRGGPVTWATGAALMISARARRLAGEWDESFFLYSEEVDYQRRIRQHGLRIEYAPAARAVHIGGDYLQNPFLAGLLAANRIRDYGRRHGRIASLLFRLGVAVGEAARAARGPAHRAALRAALTAKDRDRQARPEARPRLQPNTPSGPQRAE